MGLIKQDNISLGLIIQGDCSTDRMAVPLELIRLTDRSAGACCTGRNCEEDIEECASQPCRNGGQCSEPNPGMFRCTCQIG